MAGLAEDKKMNMLDELDNLNQIVDYQEYLEAEQANIAAKRIENLTGNFKIQN